MTSPGVLARHTSLLSETIFHYNKDYDPPKTNSTLSSASNWRAFSGIDFKSALTSICELMTFFLLEL